MTRGAGVAGVVAAVGLGVALVGCTQAPATGLAPAQGPLAPVAAAGPTAGPAAGPTVGPTVGPTARPTAPPPGMTPGDGFSIADVVFLQQMIPHHELALRVAGMAMTRASSPGVADVARQLQVESAEVQRMSDWLSSLGIDPRSATSGGHGHGGGPTDQDLVNLANLSGAAFDNAFRELMIQHSLGATQLARAEAQQGSNADARRLAAQIATRESDRVITLQRLR